MNEQPFDLNALLKLLGQQQKPQDTLYEPEQQLPPPENLAAFLDILKGRQVPQDKATTIGIRG